MVPAQQGQKQQQSSLRALQRKRNERRRRRVLLPKRARVELTRALLRRKLLELRQMLATLTSHHWTSLTTQQSEFLICKIDVLLVYTVKLKSAQLAALQMKIQALESAPASEEKDPAEREYKFWKTQPVAQFSMYRIRQSFKYCFKYCYGWAHVLGTTYQ